MELGTGDPRDGVCHPDIFLRTCLSRLMQEACLLAAPCHSASQSLSWSPELALRAAPVQLTQMY